MGAGWSQAELATRLIKAHGCFAGAGHLSEGDLGEPVARIGDGHVERAAGHSAGLLIVRYVRLGEAAERRVKETRQRDADLLRVTLR